MTAAEVAAMDEGGLRVRSNLEAAASLTVSGDTVKVVNLTSHKLISGYPEGRRMWLDIRWFDAVGDLLREDGAYGDLQTEMDLDGDGTNDVVRSLLDLSGTNTRIYEVHGAITQEWADQLVAINAAKYADHVVAYDRVTGAPTATLSDLAAQAPGTYLYSFHFVLNNKVATDTRIPPYGFSYDEARRRNALPVPATQYGDPGPGGEYRYWDEMALNPPAGAASADIRLMFQPTTWEYVKFLYLANTTTNPQLSTTGKDYLDAWLATGMAEPHVMATATWTPSTPVNEPPTASFTFTCTDLTCDLDASASSDPDGAIVSYDWDLGDGTSTTGVTTSHSYAADGDYTVTLTVTDDEGATASVAHDVSVSVGNASPTALFTFSCVDLTCAFDASASSDPDGTIAAWDWSFGDGGTDSGTTVQYVYAVAGTFTVTLTVTDDLGATAAVTQAVTVTDPVVNLPPVASFVATCTNLDCTFDGTGSTDDGIIVSYAWSFGDGTTGTGATTNHAYAMANTYTVTLTVTDDGGLTGVASQDVTVTSAVPGPGPGGPRR
jgi:PKD repeat protein